MTILDRTLSQTDVEKILDQVIITPESKEQYEKRIGYGVEVIEIPGEVNKGVIFEDPQFTPKRYYCRESLETKKRLAEAGIEAIVGANLSIDSCRIKFYYGLPVRKKQGGPYR